MSEPVTIINAFSVPAEEAEPFLRWWKDAARIMADRPGMVRARMHRSLDDSTELRFVNVAERARRDLLEQATASPEFRAAIHRMLEDPDPHITARPGVYKVAAVRPGEVLS